MLRRPKLLQNARVQKHLRNLSPQRQVILRILHSVPSTWHPVRQVQALSVETVVSQSQAMKRTSNRISKIRPLSFRKSMLPIAQKIVALLLRNNEIREIFILKSIVDNFCHHHLLQLACRESHQASLRMVAFLHTQMHKRRFKTKSSWSSKTRKH